MKLTLLFAAMFQEANFNATKQTKRQCLRENGLRMRECLESLTTTHNGAEGCG